MTFLCYRQWTLQLRLTGQTELLLACSCICKLVSFGWSDPGQQGPKFLGFSQLSLRPKILITVLRAVWRNLFSFHGGFAFHSFLLDIQIAYIYIGVATQWLSDNKKMGKRVIYFLFGFIRLIICIYGALQTNVLLLLFSYSILVRVELAEQRFARLLAVGELSGV